MRPVRLVVLSALLFGCGGEDGEDGAVGRDGRDGVDGKSASPTNLPVGSRECPAGGVKIAVGEEDHYVCNGQAGQAGAPGQPGQPTGSTQPSTNQAFRPLTVMNCRAQTALPSGKPVRLSYNVVKFSDGSSFVTCEADATALVGGSGTYWYAPWQVGAAAENCQLTSDGSGTPTGGWWEFNKSSGNYRATYHDVGTPDDLAFYAFKTADCANATAP